MSFLDKLERALGRFAVPHLTVYIIVGQVGVLSAAMLGLLDPGLLVLVPGWVVVGQWWRLFTFLFLPPYFPTSLLGYVFLAFGWWFFYFMGNALEEHWSHFRYNLYLFLGYALTVGLSFIAPHSPVGNLFLAGSVFLAFAYLNPDFGVTLYLILPVKIKWLAMLAWAGYAYTFVTGGWSVRLQVLAATGNFFIFFSGDAWRKAGLRLRQSARESAARPTGEPRHRCRICGKTDLSNPELDFRYCSQCAGEECYCPEHIFNHEHVRGAAENNPGS